MSILDDTNKDSLSIKSPHHNWLTDALLIALGTGIVYLLAFIFQFGYCEQMKIPTEFIQIELSNILWIAARISYFMLYYGFNLRNFWESKPTSIWGELIYPWGPLFVCSAIIIGYDSTYYMGYLAISMCALLMLIQVVIATIKYRRDASKPTLALKLAALNEEEKSKWSFARRFKERFGNSIYIISTYLICIGLTCYHVGIAAARSQTEFLIPSKIPDTIVLRIYGGKAICARLKSPKTILRIFSVYELKSEQLGSLEIKQIGPLSIKKD